VIYTSKQAEKEKCKDCGAEVFVGTVLKGKEAVPQQLNADGTVHRCQKKDAPAQATLDMAAVKKDQADEACINAMDTLARELGQTYPQVEAMVKKRMTANNLTMQDAIKGLVKDLSLQMGQVPEKNVALVEFEERLPMEGPTLVDVKTAAAYRATFDDLKAQLLRKSDIVTIKTKEGPRTYIKKSGWRILAAAFNISDVIESKEHIVAPATGIETWIFVVRATTPGGRSATGIASCASNERAGMRASDVMATAHTRAKNRAISDLIAAGEISAEEVGDQ